MTTRKSTQHVMNRNWPMAGVEMLPQDVFKHIYNFTTGYDLQRAGQAWKLRTGIETWTLPRAKDALRITHIGNDPETRVFQKYQLPGKVEVESGDRVVDVGGFIGEFSIRAWESDLPERITTIEPDTMAYHCLTNNAPHTIDTREVAVSNSDCYAQFTVGRDRSESGLFGADDGGKATYEIRTRRLDSLVDDLDFLKIDAEGGEPEVIMGMGQLRPEKVAVDVSPERGGESTLWECEELLRNRGYAVAEDDDVLFGWMR